MNRVVQQLVLGSWLDKIVFVLAIHALFSTPLQVLRLMTDLDQTLRLVISGAVAGGVAAFVFSFSGKLNALITNFARSIDSIPLWLIVVMGLLLRLAWVGCFPSQPGSDGAVYLKLADGIIHDRSYEIAGTKAYWPVGYPLFLALWLFFIDNHRLAYVLANMSLYFVAIFGIAGLAGKMSGGKGARFAAFIFAIWPNLIANMATPEKETLIVAILPWATLFLLEGFEDRGYGRVFLSGLLLGAATLIQPSLQLLPLFAVLLLFIVLGLSRASMVKGVLLILATAVTLFPWSLRNYLEFDHFVLVSTNGGGNLYRANNPLATGGYVAKGQVDLSPLSEIEQDKQGKKLAIQWMLAEPKDFLLLSLEKQVRFMGDDAVGVYDTFKVGNIPIDKTLYAMAKGVADLFWMIVWFSLASLALHRGRSKISYAYIPLWIWLYLFVIHSVFESAGKYHVPVLWVLSVLLAYYCLAGDSAGQQADVGSVPASASWKHATVYRQFVRFLMVGGLATLIQYAILFLLVHFLATNVVVASSIGFGISAVFNYLLNYRFTFSADVGHHKAVPKFALVAGMGLYVNGILIWFAHDYLSLHYLVSQVFATGGTILWNFVMNKIWTFRQASGGALRYEEASSIGGNHKQG